MFVSKLYVHPCGLYFVCLNIIVEQVNTQLLHDLRCVNFFLSKAINNDSKKQYSGKIRRFIEWLDSRNLPIILPTPERHLVLFAAYRRTVHNVLVDTIRGDMSAILYWNIVQGYSFRTKDMAVLQKCYNGMLRTGGASSPDSRLPATVSFLRQCKRFFNMSNYDHVVLFTSFVVAVFGMLRLGEFTLRDRSVEPVKFLRCENLKFIHKRKSNISFAKLFLRHSKGDIYNRGVDIILGAVTDELCPVKFLRLMLRKRMRLAKKRGFGDLRLSAEAPLFMLSDGSILWRGHVTDCLKQCASKLDLDESRFTGHSFRIGGATSLARRGVPDYIIKMLGRWKSQTFRVYCRYNRIGLAQAARYFVSGDICDPDVVFEYKKQVKR